MGFHLKFIWKWNRTISIYVVIALIVGAGAGYIVGNSPVSSLMEEKDGLEAEYDSLYLDLQSLAAELDSAQELLVELQRDNNLLMDRYRELLLISRENQVLIQQVIDLEAEIARLQDALLALDPESAMIYVGSINSNIYHNSSCYWAQKINLSNEIWFISKSDAEAHGYIQCQVCKP